VDVTIFFRVYISIFILSTVQHSRTFDCLPALASNFALLLD